MNTQPWIREASELGQRLRAALRWAWEEMVVPFCATVGAFLIMAAPILLTMLLLWYLDSVGWRPSQGFYTIGSLWPGTGGVA